MEKELNIAAILRDKPENTKLWCSIYGEAYLKKINSNEIVNITHHGGYNVALTKNGKSWNDGECVLFPSKSMRDWSKFAWKKGDVLVSNGEHVIFDKWTNNSYTTFKGVFYSIDKVSLICLTSVWEKETNEVQINKYISQIEKDGGGKLNLSTLEIEKSSEFKDGDIVTIEETSNRPKAILVYKGTGDIEHCLHRAFYIPIDDYLEIKNDRYFIKSRFLRPATEEEKQQLFAALAEKNKTWDAEKKAIVDLPKKCGFKPMDWCLMRDFGEKWKLCQFGFKDETEDADHAPYNAIGGNWFNECIPYNDQTAHLLGTTDDWEGGEE